ncbi:MAG: flagellar basal-body MS-ring/collar protein FliF, partial [Actinomycetota bacterium]
MARPSIQAVGQNALSSFERMTGPQRLTLGLAFAATAIGVFLVAQATNSTPMGTLAADLEPDVAAEVTAALEARNVPYELEAGGRVVQVPVDQVHQLRIDLAGQNVLGGTDGWTVLDDQGITASAFDQRVGYQRAMEGELAQTIASIDVVRSANVHLVIPESDLFLDDEQMASASVLVDTGSQTLSGMQVQAVINLVASSIEGMTPDAVSLADQTGRVLAAPGGATGGLDLDGDARFAARLEFERALGAKVENLLTNIAGPGLAIVEVSANLDYDASSTTSESVTPILTDDGEQAVISESVKQQFTRSEIPGAEEGGELEIELPDDIDIDGDGVVDENVIWVDNERQFDAAFESVVSTTQNTPGAVTDLSVAVLLDDADIA